MRQRSRTCISPAAKEPPLKPGESPFPSKMRFGCILPSHMPITPKEARDLKGRGCFLFPRISQKSGSGRSRDSFRIIECPRSKKQRHKKTTAMLLHLAEALPFISYCLLRRRSGCPGINLYPPAPVSGMGAERMLCAKVSSRDPLPPHSLPYYLISSPMVPGAAQAALDSSVSICIARA